MTTPFVDIILLCYGNFVSNTKPCLDSLVAESNAPHLRLTVIDNGSLDNSADQLKEYLKAYPHVRAEYIEKNVGYAGGMNHGATLAEAEWLFLITNDTVFAPDALLTIVNTLRELPSDIGLLSPITNAAGNEQEYKIKGSKNEILEQAKFLQEHPCHFLPSAYRLDFFCVAIRKSVWNKLKGFDPVYGKGYYEDTDFSMRAKSAGYRMVVCEDAFVYHAGSATLSVDPNTRQLIKRNKKIFQQRHPRATLYHKRQCNLSVLEEYARQKQQGLWNEGLAIRAKLRIEALASDLPRSPIKKWLWRYKTKKILNQFA